MAHLNDTTVKSLRVPANLDRKEFWFDEKGLGMRISKTGRKSWIYVYHYMGHSRRLTFGTYPTIGVAAVRALHAKAMQQLEGGIDPGDTLQVQRSQIRNSPTVGDLADDYLSRHASQKKTGEKDRQMLNRDVLPKWKNIRANQITRLDVTDLLDGIVGRGSPISANRILALVRKMFNFGIERSMVEANPCDRIRQPAANRQRDRYMSSDEIRTFWNNLDNAKMSEGSKLALRLQLVTAQRKGEIVNAEWSEINFEDRVWTIPAHKAKNGLAHRVPLTDLALDILGRLHELAAGSKYCLPSRIGDKPVIETSVDHALRSNLDLIGIADLTPHDLRRTAASYMTSIGIPRLTVSKILNHADSSVTAIYDRHGYDPEKQQALTQWSQRLSQLCKPPALIEGGTKVL